MKRLIVIVLACSVGAVLFWIFRKPKVVDKSLATYTGKIEDYRGNKKLIVAFTASWASFWKLTESELQKLDKDAFDLCIVDDALEHSIVKSFGINFLPTVALVEHGKITKKIQNLSSIDLLKDWK